METHREKVADMQKQVDEINPMLLVRHISPSSYLLLTTPILTGTRAAGVDYLWSSRRPQEEDRQEIDAGDRSARASVARASEARRTDDRADHGGGAHQEECS